jgi:cell division protein FtsL
MEKSRMKGLGGLLRWTFTLSVLLGALVFLTWRQSRALEVLAQLDEIGRELSLAEAEIVDLERDIQVLESRVHVVPTATEQLGMRLPAASEQVILFADTRQ